MKKFYKNYLENNGFFLFFSIASLLLIVAGFVVPPTGVVDGSVLIAVGELNVTLAIGAVIKAVDNGESATFKHKDTEITISKDENEQDEDDK